MSDRLIQGCVDHLKQKMRGKYHAHATFPDRNVCVRYLDEIRDALSKDGITARYDECPDYKFEKCTVVSLESKTKFVPT
jgi:hypothetical protein